MVNAIGFTDFNSSVYTSNVSVQATSDGSNWNVTLANASYSSGGTKVITFKNSTAYLGYRLVINGYVGGWIALRAGLYFGESKDVITARALTGGVIYSDEHGQPSMSDKRKGAWPINNEWDRYIVNFPTNKIQAGKTIDDVFHYADNYTWVQETPLYGTWTDFAGTTDSGASNSTRMARGNNNRSVWRDLSYDASSYTSATWGFRPVFEYKEA
ncbi:hypothetical protein FB479_106194 [Brevibacillus sp. AG162]|nr:hypothetical protein [Brevibacillus sp. AG162]TQK62111.1 hypothetical protein FB479_106194 [Brevibacillus sp. AG162]